MNPFGWARRALRVDYDPLADFRDAIALKLSDIGAVALLGFALVQGLDARVGPALVNLCVALVLGLNALSLRRRRRAALPYIGLAPVLVGAVCASVLLQGVPGLFWAYPTVFICFFILPRWQAMLVGLLTLVVVTAVAAIAVGPALAVRYFASLSLVLVMISVVFNVVADLQQALVAQAVTDPLTGAYNRRHLQRQLAEVRPASPEGHATDALLAIDIDHFKTVNDRFGHDVGDEVLKSLVLAVGARTRPGDLLFRTGGEEFALLLRRVTPQAALQVAEALRLQLAQAELLPGQPVTVSIGVSTRGRGQGGEAWFKCADMALYEAKRAGRDCVVAAPGDCLS
ncbi:MAG: GGDEF domain-containing protein [Rubrivivax sp.]|nr:GGDEF domain-containing protein [Rubrivivax sp.]